MQDELDRWRNKIKPFTDNREECWEWQGAKYRKGYGHFRRKINGKWVMYKAHRYSYETFVGPIPEGMKVCHTCDNPGCVNFVHLFVGTTQDNVDDKVAKGRQGFGRNPDHMHLSKELADEIREGWFYERMKFSCTQAQYAEAYGISTTQMSRILNNKIWN